MDLKDKKKTKNKPQKGTPYWIVLFMLSAGLSSAFGQASSDTLKLNKQQYEELFLKQNLLLIAEKYNIDQASALLLQAKLWPNPSISIDEVNLWSTKKQLASLDRPLPPIFGDIAKNTQFSAQIEQLIQTAGKRKKRIAVEQISVDIAIQQFEEILRNLKLDFRTNISRLQYLQHYQQVYVQQQLSVQHFLKSYRKQVELRNVSQAEFIRLQALQLELSKEINALTKERNEVETELKIQLHVPSASLYVNDEKFIHDLQTLKGMSLASLYEQALSSRPDLKIADLENKQYAILHQYEQAQRVPNLTLKSSYNRGSGLWPNFLGFGLAIDLPLFDRNQGNTKHARLGMDQTHILLEEKHFRVRREVSQGYKNLLAAVAFYESIDPQYNQELEDLLSNYTRNFANRNISLLEYLDFQNAYLENKKIILESRRDLHLHLEELQYTIGTEIN